MTLGYNKNYNVLEGFAATTESPDNVTHRYFITK